MAATQVGTGSLTLGDPSTTAGTYVTVPSGAIIESVNVTTAGDAQMETQYDSDGAFHTDLWYEKRQTGAVVVMVGKAYTGTVGATDKASYEVVSIVVEYSKGPLRTTVTVKKVASL
jgi:hypothetical protein